MPRSRDLSALLVLFCAVLLLGASSCGGDDDDPEAQPTTTEPSTTQSPEAEDEAALRQLAEDWDAAITRIYLGEVTRELAEDYVAEPYLGEFVDQLDAFLESGQQIEVGDQSDHVVRSVEVDGQVATVEECVVDGDVLLDAEGAVVNDEVQVNIYSTEAAKSSDGWRFIGRTLISEEEGQSCE